MPSSCHRVIHARAGVLVLLLMRLCVSTSAVAPATVQVADTVVIDSFDYVGAEAARQVWTPVYDLPPVSVVERGRGSALRLPCPFSQVVSQPDAEWRAVGATLVRP